MILKSEEVLKEKTVVLIPYISWLLMTRKEIRPEIGDIVIPIDKIDKYQTTSILPSDPYPVATTYISHTDLYAKEFLYYYFVEVEIDTNQLKQLICPV